jgi:hypothetical protein
VQKPDYSFFFEFATTQYAAGAWRYRKLTKNKMHGEIAKINVAYRKVNTGNETHHYSCCVGLDHEPAIGT